jgi:hypothetical protein
MTRLDRPVRRETDVSVRDGGRARTVLIELHPRHIELRRKGTRRRLLVAYEAVYDLAAKLLARSEREERLAAKKAKKGGQR